MRFGKYPVVIIAGALCILAAVAAGTEEDSSAVKREAKMELTCPSFKEGDSIPAKFTCHGADLSPELHIDNIPATAKSLVLICEDPDAPSGNWVHWVLYNIPPEMTVIPENVLKVVTPVLKTKGKEVALMQGRNDFGKYGYGGPCPPHGAPHRYFFRLYALDSKPVFTREETVRGIIRKSMLEKIKGHIVAEAVLMGIYQRQ